MNEDQKTASVSADFGDIQETGAVTEGAGAKDDEGLVRIPSRHVVEPAGATRTDEVEHLEEINNTSEIDTLVQATGLATRANRSRDTFLEQLEQLEKLPTCSALQRSTASAPVMVGPEAIRKWAAGKGLVNLLRSLGEAFPHMYLAEEKGEEWVPKDSSEGEVQKAYKRATRYIHPDRLQQQGEDLVHEAQEVLKVLTRAHANYNKGLSVRDDQGNLSEDKLLKRFRTAASADDVVRLLHRFEDVLNGRHLSLLWTSLSRCLRKTAKPERRKWISAKQDDLAILFISTERALPMMDLHTLLGVASSIASCSFAQQPPDEAVVSRALQLIPRVDYLARSLISSGSVSASFLHDFETLMSVAHELVGLV